MHVLVTGSAGFIGSHLAERLAAAGHAVTGVDALTPYYDRAAKRRNERALQERGVETLRLDLATDPLGPALTGVDAVCHLAAQPGLAPAMSPEVFRRNNVRATRRLTAALQRHPRLRAFVHVSSSSVYGADATAPEDSPLAPVSDYGRTKLQAERVVAAASTAAAWDACTVRLFSVYGPRERPDKLVHKAARCALTGEAFPLHRGSERHMRSYTYVGDAVRGIVQALRRFGRCAGETLNLGAPESASTAQVLDLVAGAVGRPLCIQRVPARAGDQRRTQARVEKARRLLGTVPSTPLREGIAAEVAWVRDALAAGLLP